MNFSRRRAAEDVEINLTPLIDVVFLLLIFFMVTTTFQVTSGIQVKLPDSSAMMPEKEIHRLVISIKAGGAVYMGEEPVDDAELKLKLEQQAGDHPESLVVIRADQGVLHGRVVDVMDAARNAGLKRMAIATVLRSER